MKAKYIFIICIVFFMITGGVSASDEKIIKIDLQQELTLNFIDSRIRVETWDREYVKINTTYLVQHSYQLEVKDNIITFDKKRHLELNSDDLDNGNVLGSILNEVYFMIYIPKDISVNIHAETANIKRVNRLKTVIAKNARIRDCIMLDDFIAKGEKIHLRESRFMGERDLDYEYISYQNKIKIFKIMQNIFNQL